MTEITTPEQFRRYYQVDYPNQLRDQVGTLNTLIGNDPDDEIAEARESIIDDENFTPLQAYWIDKNTLRIPQEEKLTTELPHYHKITVEQFLAIAMLAIQRINHVHRNTSLTPERKEDGLQLIEESQHLAEYLEIDSLPQFTVDGNEIFWRGEVVQDIANTYMKIGRQDLALAFLKEYIETLEGKLMDESGKGLTAGEESALAVMKYRSGDMTHNLREKMEGLLTELGNSDRQLNISRLMYLIGGIARSAMSKEYDVDRETRIEAAKLVGKSWLFALRQRPSKTLEITGKGLAKPVVKKFRKLLSL